MNKHFLTATLIAIGIVASALLPSAEAETARQGAYPVVVGQANVTDGDTIRMGHAMIAAEGKTKEFSGVRIRLFGIDAPEKRQTCFKNQEKWSCGTEATKELTAMVRNKEITCQILDIDRYDRLVAVCSVAGIPDINAELVKRGFAVAYREYSMDYVDEEDAARKAGLGLWTGDFDMPWEFRTTN